MRIEIKNDYKKKIPEWLISELNGDMLLANLLLNRGINTKEKLESFLYPAKYEPIDPDEFSNMNSTIKRLLKAIDENEKIIIYGDYDVDGVTSTSIFVSFLKKFNVKVDYHIPDRFKEGYGMSKNVIRDITENFDLILSCDCGISNYEEIKLAKKLGLDVIVTDHHDLPEKLPPADFILTPKFLPTDNRAHNLPGAGMAYYLVKGTLNYLVKNNLTDKYLKTKVKSEEFIDLLALAIVADVVPLKGENRYLLQKGLNYLKNTERNSLNKLFKLIGINKKLINEEDIAFRIGPIINAAGRMENANIAVEMLLAEDEKFLEKLIKKMLKINKRRKKLQEKIILEAENMLKKEFFADEPNKAIILYQPHWHEGLLGIAAGRLAEDYNLPVLLMSLKEDEKTITGSARSISGIHINNMLKKVKDHLIKAGGHEAAAGFSLERDNYMLFKKKISAIINEKLKKISRERVFEVDARINLSEIDLESYYSLRKLAPFGEKNPKPLFISENCKLLQSRSFSEDKHLRLLIKQSDAKKKAIWWWGGKENISSNLDLIYYLDINRFQGKENLQLIVEEAVDSDYSYTPTVQNEFLDFLKVIDMRNWKEKDNLKRRILSFNEAIYYQEGMEEKKYNPVIDRYKISKSKKLILISFPPDFLILRDLLYNNEPSELILAFNRKDLYEKDSFLNKLMALIKYVLNEKNGMLNVAELAVLTGELEVTIEVALKYLEAAGYLNLDKISENNYFIKRGNKIEEGKKNIYKNNLKDLLKESNSFKKFLLDSSSNKILNYIKKG